MEMYIVWLAKNSVTQRFHPVFLVPHPRPSEDWTDSAVRYRSKGHHNDGFDTLESAKEFVTKIEKKLDPAVAVLDDQTNIVFDWDPYQEEKPLVSMTLPHPPKIESAIKSYLEKNAPKP